MSSRTARRADPGPRKIRSMTRWAPARSAGITPLNLRRQLVAAGDLELARLLDVDRLHHAVINQHGIALGAVAHSIAAQVERQIQGLGEIGAAVGKKLDA